VVEFEDDPTKSMIDALAKKYVGRDVYGKDGPRDDRVIIRVTPTHVSVMN
jgi:hypothetical protein